MSMSGKRVSKSGGFQKREASGFPFLAEFLESRANPFRYHQPTKESYVKHLRVVFRDARELGFSHPNDLTTEAVEALERVWAARVRPITVVGYLRHLKTYLHWCHEKGHVPEAPAFKIPKVQTVINTVCDDEFAELLRACRYTTNPLRDRALLLVMGRAGLRVAEVCRLKVEDYKQGRLRLLETKTGNDRWLPPPPSVCHAIDQYLKKERPRTHIPNLFLTQDGRPLKTDAVNKLCNRLERLTGTSFSPHKLRHYFATTGVRRGVPPFVIKEFLGHFTLTMTMRYVKMTGADLDRFKGSWD
jgi:site-specific recombinase XerD